MQTILLSSIIQLDFWGLHKNFRSFGWIFKASNSSSRQKHLVADEAFVFNAQEKSGLVVDSNVIFFRIWGNNMNALAGYYWWAFFCFFLLTVVLFQRRIPASDESGWYWKGDDFIRNRGGCWSTTFRQTIGYALLSTALHVGFNNKTLDINNITDIIGRKLVMTIGFLIYCGALLLSWFFKLNSNQFYYAFAAGQSEICSFFFLFVMFCIC